MARRTVRGIEIEKLAHGGDGLGYLPDGRVLFVKDGLPGDIVDVEVIKEKKSFARGRVKEVTTPSKHRVAVQCEAFENGCGGCQFWGVGYDQEMEWKVQAAWEAMKRISKLDLADPRVEKAPTIFHYRNRVIFHQRREGDDLRRGFFAARSRKIIDVQRCPVAHKAINEAIEEFGGPLSMVGKADIMMETAGDGGVVVLVELLPGERISHDALNELSRRLEQGVVVRGIEILDDRGKYFILGDTTVAASEILARPPLESMQVKAGRFRQANSEVNRKLVDYIRDAVEEKFGGDDAGPAPRIVELYCGSGNFSFPLAELAGELVGYEGSSAAVEAASQMVEMDDEMTHVHFEVADLSEIEVVSQVLSEPFDILVLDPPRDGAPEVAEEMVGDHLARQIIYISCDAACLARDLKTLCSGGWKLEELTFFDMFPRTAHLETVAILTRE